MTKKTSLRIRNDFLLSLQKLKSKEINKESSDDDTNEGEQSEVEQQANNLD